MRQYVENVENSPLARDRANVKQQFALWGKWKNVNLRVSIKSKTTKVDNVLIYVSISRGILGARFVMRKGAGIENFLGRYKKFR